MVTPVEARAARRRPNRIGPFKARPKEGPRHKPTARPKPRVSVPHRGTQGKVTTALSTGSSRR